METHRVPQVAIICICRVFKARELASCMGRLNPRSLDEEPWPLDPPTLRRDPSEASKSARSLKSHEDSLSLIICVMSEEDSEQRMSVEAISEHIIPRFSGAILEPRPSLNQLRISDEVMTLKTMLAPKGANRVRVI